MLRAHHSDSHIRAIPRKPIADLRAAVAEVDPNLPLLHVTTIQDQVSNLISHDQLISTLTSLFSLLALLLAAIGLYGVMSYNVARRTNEIGIRLALGAQGASVLRMIMRESILLLAIGTGVGLPLAIMAARIHQGPVVCSGCNRPNVLRQSPSGRKPDDSACRLAACATRGQGQPRHCASM